MVGNIANKSDKVFEGSSYCQIEALTGHVPAMTEESQEKSVSLNGILVEV
jgi:hypothetical protein